MAISGYFMEGKPLRGICPPLVPSGSESEEELCEKQGSIALKNYNTLPKDDKDSKYAISIPL